MCISNESALHIIRLIKRIYHRYALNHVLLLLMYTVYLLIGTITFCIVESHNSIDHYRHWQRRINDQRYAFIVHELLPDIFNNSRFLVFIHDDKSQYLIDIMFMRLSDYEQRLRIRTPIPIIKWTLSNSLFYCWSTITTIGYGYIYPVTKTGRILSIVYCIFGIPLTIITIKDIAYLLAKLLNYPSILLGNTTMILSTILLTAYIWHLFRYCTLKPVDERQLCSKWDSERQPTRADFRLAIMTRMLNIPATIAILALVGWISIGCALLSLIINDIDTSVGFYLVFNSLTTIGVGDIDLPTVSIAIQSAFIVYILIGLAIVSLFINLLHTKFSRAYWLPDRLYLHHHRAPSSISNVASFDSDNDDLVNDIDLNHYVTLGVIQAEDRRPLLGVLRREHARRHVHTQTTVTLQQHGDTMVMMPKCGFIDEQATMTTSRDDVNRLMTETYTRQ